MASVTLYVRSLEGKRLELSTPNFVDVRYTAIAQNPLRSEGQGHAVIKCAAGVDVHVDRTT